jgi:hypothetical protein
MCPDYFVTDVPILTPVRTVPPFLEELLLVLS